jgi:DNA-binding HxlR family transcriptional regulator
MSGHDAHPCCPLYHEAIELIGRRWTGAILQVLLRGPHRFSEIRTAVPALSDRLLSERMKELEARGIVDRAEQPGPPPRVTYELTEMGQELGPALMAVEDWAHRWLAEQPAAAAR